MIVCQKEMEVRRFEEEIVLLEREMKQYLIYYKDSVIPGLKEQMVLLNKRQGENCKM